MLADPIGQLVQLVFAEPGPRRRRCRRPGFDGLSEGFDTVCVLCEVIGVCTAGEQIPHEKGQQRKIAPGFDHQMAVGQLGRLGRARVGDPHLGILDHPADRHDRIGEGVQVPVTDDGVGTEEAEQRARLPVGRGHEAGESRHQLGHEQLVGGVDGGGRVLALRAEGPLQALGGPTAVRIERHPGGDVEADCVSSVPVDDVEQARR